MRCSLIINVKGVVCISATHTRNILPLSIYLLWCSYSFMIEIQPSSHSEVSRLKKLESKEKVFNTRILPVLTVVAFLHK